MSAHVKLQVLSQKRTIHETERSGTNVQTARPYLGMLNSDVEVSTHDGRTAIMLATLEGGPSTAACGT